MAFPLVRSFASVDLRRSLPRRFTWAFWYKAAEHEELAMEASWLSLIIRTCQAWIRDCSTEVAHVLTKSSGCRGVKMPIGVARGKTELPRLVFDAVQKPCTAKKQLVARQGRGCIESFVELIRRQHLKLA